MFFAQRGLDVKVCLHWGQLQIFFWSSSSQRLLIHIIQWLCPQGPATWSFSRSRQIKQLCVPMNFLRCHLYVKVNVRSLHLTQKVLCFFSHSVCIWWSAANGLVCSCTRLSYSFNRQMSGMGGIEEMSEQNWSWSTWETIKARQKSLINYSKQCVLSICLHYEDSTVPRLQLIGYIKVLN